jgi:ribosomal protein S6--L-glutamate ligase
MVNIWVLTQIDKSPSCDMLIGAAKRLGHELIIVHPFDLHLVFTGDIPALSLCLPENLRTLPDIVYTRMGSLAPDAILHTVRHFEALGVRCVNSSYSLERGRNKVYCFHEMVRHQIPIPRTALLSPRSDIKNIVEMIPGPPWIVKLPTGSKGKGVVLAESQRSLQSLVDAFHSVDQRLILQEFISEADSTDLRVLVVGGKVLAAMRRRAAAGEFRANIFRGAKPEYVEIYPELAAIAGRAAEALQMGVAGVDLIETRDGLKLIEINASPGLIGLQSVQQIDLAEYIVKFLAETPSRAATLPATSPQSRDTQLCT